MKLSAYQIEEIKYRPGKLNANPDSLSRNTLPDDIVNQHEVSTIEIAVNLWQNTNILKDIKEEQQVDPKLKQIIFFLETKTTTDSKDKRNPHILVNGLLYKIKNSNIHYNQRIIGEKHLLVIPKTMQNKVLGWAHDHPTAGHGGQQKTLFRLTTRVYWESMKKDVFNYIYACQQFKYNNAPTASPIQLHAVNEPWHTIGMDIMGPFPTTARQKRFLLVIVDYFTRWIELFPLNSITSIDITNILTNEIFSKYGLPKHIVSDNGKYDRHTTDRRYAEGDLVWVAIPTKQIGENSIAGKLQPHYQGPCRLIKQLTPSTFTVLRINDNIQLGATSTDRLKPYFEPIINKRNTTVTENDQTTNERQRTTTNINDESMDDDLNLQNVK
ncbi:unnamed protein product [Rotaria socialis]|uniref:Integrase catalytic domain-containing protein n=1 Tax=Rotaria socialis TaxID=392032 RepID=A0A818AH19_9BILA|nr:unnamed protein product [Rotaria socialis]